MAIPPMPYKAKLLNSRGFMSEPWAKYILKTFEALGGITGTSDLSTISSSVSTNTSNISTNASNISTLQSDVSTAQSDIVELQNEVFMLDVGDESSDLTVGTSKKTFRMPFSFTLSSIRASVNTAPAGSTVIIDVNEGGATILSTKLTIDAGEKTSVTAAVPLVISDSVLAEDAEITIDIDQVGSSTAGKGLKIQLLGART
jgi:hypothetical protein